VGTNVVVHHFESTGEAYNRSQVDPVIKNGDVLVVDKEHVVGFLYHAWPLAVSEKRGEFHTYATDRTTQEGLAPIFEENGLYKESIVLCEKEIDRLQMRGSR
jgi:hypothetical protein